VHRPIFCLPGRFTGIVAMVLVAAKAAMTAEFRTPDMPATGDMD
jgi:hypothetical protein